MPAREFTVVYRSTAGTSDGSSEPPEWQEMLLRLNGDRPRQPLPRFVGVVPAFSCAVRGESEQELIDNARRAIEGTARIRANRAEIASEGAPVIPKDDGALDITAFPTGTKVVTVRATIKEH